MSQFKSNISKIKRKIGYGSYGVVKVGHYNQQDGQSQQVVVEVPRDIRGNKREFAKEARHLNSINGHPNIVSFIAISVSPFWLMIEYVKFSFRPFEDDRVLSSLSEFLSHADLQFEFKGFEHVVPVIAKEVAVGLKFLHENGIAHRDLKPANILLTNDHYIHVSVGWWIRIYVHVGKQSCRMQTCRFWGRPFKHHSKSNHFVIEGAGTRSRPSRIHVTWNFAAGIKTKRSYP